MLAEMLAGKGRKGDTEVGHLTEGEWVIPAKIMASIPGLEDTIRQIFTEHGVDPERYRVGGSDDSVNPETGMPEYEFGTSADRGYSGGENDSRDFGGGGDQGNGFAGSPEVGPNHAQQVNNAFSGEQNTYGGGPEEVGGGYVSAFGFSPARYNNPMTTAGPEYGMGFNPGAMMGSLAGNLMGGPLGGMAGSMLGRQFADTRFSIPGYGNQQKPQQGPQRQGSDNILARLLQGQ